LGVSGEIEEQILQAVVGRAQLTKRNTCSQSRLTDQRRIYVDAKASIRHGDLDTQSAQSLAKAAIVTDSAHERCCTTEQIGFRTSGHTPATTDHDQLVGHQLDLSK
jgi:hypothetical protein